MKFSRSPSSYLHTDIVRRLSCFHNHTGHSNKVSPLHAGIWFRNIFLKPHQTKKQIYFFKNSSDRDFTFGPEHEPYQTIQYVEQFGVRALKGGFRRRPELIRDRKLDIATMGWPVGVRSYGLFDKCERIQQELTVKLLELMNVPDKLGCSQWMLDIGCGHGWSLTVPVQRGFQVTAVDLDFEALGVVKDKVRSGYLPSDKVHVFRLDVSSGFCFRDNLFDYAISVSFLQWLCVGRNSDKLLDQFFVDLKRTLKPGGKAGIQFYPRNIDDVSRVIFHAQNNFRGALISDFPHLDRGKKLFLVLQSV
jgi:SAM-dependent methyltransferase